MKRRDMVGGKCNYIRQNMTKTSTSLDYKLPSKKLCKQNIYYTGTLIKKLTVQICEPVF